MPGIHDDRLGQVREAANRAVKVGSALAGVDRQIGPRRVAHEERVAGQDEPVVEHERAVLGPVAGRVHDADRDAADVHRHAVLEGLERILRPRERVDRDRQAVLEREAPVARDVIGVRVRLEHPFDADAALGGGVEERFDLERGVDDDGDPGFVVTYQVRRTAEVVVDELPEEQHRREVTPAYFAVA